MRERESATSWERSSLPKPWAPGHLLGSLPSVSLAPTTSLRDKTQACLHPERQLSMSLTLVVMLRPPHMVIPGSSGLCLP